MTHPSQSFQRYARGIAATGLSVRGAFHVSASDGVPATGDGNADQTLILIGNAGSSFWPMFRRSGEYNDGQPDPLDRWSRRVIVRLAGELNAHALFPFDGPPYHPFQRWARRAEPLSRSPMGMLIHPVYGLWHAYRGALVVDGHLDLPDGPEPESPCLGCEEQPCLHTCPVDAFQAQGFDADQCARHLSGTNHCQDQGCLARNACPAGVAFRYETEQHRFHLRAFLKARTHGGNGKDAA